MKINHRESREPKPGFLKGLIKWMSLCVDQAKEIEKAQIREMKKGNLKEAFQILQIVKVKKGQCVQFYAIVFEN